MVIRGKNARCLLKFSKVCRGPAAHRSAVRGVAKEVDRVSLECLIKFAFEYLRFVNLLQRINQNRVLVVVEPTWSYQLAPGACYFLQRTILKVPF